MKPHQPGNAFESLIVRGSTIGSSLALVRPITETLYRALWVNGCATPTQLDELRSNDGFEFPKDMMEKIDRAYSPEGSENAFQSIKRASWKTMCSYTHSGLLQISRRFHPDGSVGPNYTEAEILEALRGATTVLLAAAEKL